MIKELLIRSGPTWGGPGGGAKIDKIETILFMDDPYLEHHMAAINGTTRRSKVRGLGDKKGQNFFLDLF